MIRERDERFFWWNDIYFMTRCQEVRFQNLITDTRIAELTEMLLYRHPPKTVHHPLFAHRILPTDGSENEKEKLIQKIKAFIKELELILKKHGTGKEWLFADIPERDVIFTTGMKQILRKRSSDNLYRERDPIKVVSKIGRPSLLVERDNTLMKHLSQFINFVPSVYANDAALTLLRSRGLVE